MTPRSSLLDRQVGSAGFSFGAFLFIKKPYFRCSPPLHRVEPPPHCNPPDATSNSTYLFTRPMWHSTQSVYLARWTHAPRSTPPGRAEGVDSFALHGQEPHTATLMSRSLSRLG